MATAALAPVGHNNPPAPTPIEAARETLADLHLTAEQWFDGADIETDGQADEVSRIVDAARKAKTRFEADRKAEKQPHLDAGKAVDTAWKPLTDAADRIVEVGKAALTPWLQAKERAKREAEAEARRVADAAAEEARRLAAQTDGSLAAAQARDDAIEQAEAAQAKADRAARDRAGAKGEGMGRTMSLRTTYRSEVEDRRALLNHVARTRPADLDTFLSEWARKAVAAGARELPGVKVWAEQVAA